MQPKPVTEVPRALFFLSPVKDNVNNGKYFLCHFFIFYPAHRCRNEVSVARTLFFLVLDDT